MRSVRVWFNKIGTIRYISHLDLMRTMTRAVRRSGLPLWYTEGFNPHPYLTFALPLSLGMESVCESMDIKIEDGVSNEEIFEKLKNVMPDGIEVTAVTDPVTDPKYIAYGEFDVKFENVENTEKLKEEIETMLSGSELIVQKLGKQGHKKVYKDINLLEFIESYSISVDEETLTLKVLLPAGSAKNVNPSLLADEILKKAENASYVIRRLNLLTADKKKFR